MIKTNEQLIGEILMDHLPKDVLEALRVMASLTYPIEDRRSFVAQIEALVKDPQKSTSPEQVEALDFIREECTAFDFPILTPVSGLEKFFAHFSDPHREYLGLDFGVDRRLLFKRIFLGVCGDQAYAAYRQDFIDRPGVPEEGHAARGYRAGWDCMNSGHFIDPSSAIGPSHRYTPVDPTDEVLDWYHRRPGR